MSDSLEVFTLQDTLLPRACAVCNRGRVIDMCACVWTQHICCLSELDTTALTANQTAIEDILIMETSVFSGS